jgi:hypothetical protein
MTPDVSFTCFVFLCNVKHFFGLILVSGTIIAGVEAQQYHVVDYGRTGPVPNLMQGFPASEEDISAEADAGWTQWMGVATAPERSNPLPLGFSLTLNGKTYTHVRAGSNGYICFDTVAAVYAGSGPAALPIATLPSPSLYFGGLSLSGSNDRLLYRYSGSAPNRALMIKWYSATSGSAFVYASAVIMENATLWTGLMYVGSNTATFKAPTLSLGFQLSASEAYMMSGSPSITPDSAIYGSSAADNHYAAYIPGPAPAYAAQWLQIPVKVYATMGKPAIFEARIANTGIRTFSKLGLEYGILGKPATTKRIAIVSMDSSSRVGMLRDTLPQASDTGIYLLQVRFISFDGNAFSAPWQVSSIYILDRGNRTARRSLAEMQTASWCAVCPAHFDALRKLESKYQAVALFHHTGDGMAHDSFSNLGTLGVPAFSINGFTDINADTAVWMKSIQDAAAEGAPCILKVNNANLSAANVLSFEVETRFTDLYQGDLRLLVALRERTVRGGGLPFDQFIAPEITKDAGSPYYQYPTQTAGFKHPNVAWLFLTPYRGTAAFMPVGNFYGGSAYKRSFSMTLPAITSLLIPATSPYPDANSNAAGRYKPAETDIVAVLWDHSNPLQPKVLQATVQPLWDAVNGNETANEQESFLMWPNPADQTVFLYFPMLRDGLAQYEILDASGRVCLSGMAQQQEHAVDISQLKPGAYWLRAGGKAQKLIVAP